MVIPGYPRRGSDSARRSRKYPENTAAALKTALRLYEPELNDAERASVENFRENLDRIYRDVFEKNKTKYSAGSLYTYKKRVSKLIGDYLNYGTDPSKMNSWSPPIRKSVSARKPAVTLVTNSRTLGDEEDGNGENEDRRVFGGRIDWPLSDGRKAVLILPFDLTSDEAKIIKDLIDLRVGKEIDNGQGKPSEAQV